MDRHYSPFSKSGDVIIRRGGEGKNMLFNLSDDDGLKSFIFCDSHRILLRILSNGNVGIGTANPDEKLTVKGKIHVEEVRVDLSVPADYVFQKYYTGFSPLKKDYKMPTLEDVEVFIKENHHLPEVPSAKQIKEEGLNLKQMTVLLLQKVEELTLYTIEQEKRIKALQKKQKN